MNYIVKLELAKLLNEKEFKNECKGYWSYNSYFKEWSVTYPQTQFNQWYKNEILAPTIAEVVMWCFDKYGIWMNVSPVFEFNSGRNDYLTIRGFQYYITVITDNKYNQEKRHAGREYKNSPTEAYEAGIEYTLNNLL